MFKVGDRVKLVKSDYTRYKENKRNGIFMIDDPDLYGIIIKVLKDDTNDYHVIWHYSDGTKENESNYWGLKDHEAELCIDPIDICIEGLTKLEEKWKNQK